MRNLAVTASITVDGVITASEGSFIHCDEGEVDQSSVREVLVR